DQVSHAQHFRRQVAAYGSALQTYLVAVGRFGEEILLRLIGPQLQALRQKLVNESNAKADEHHSRGGATSFPGHEHLSARSSFRVLERGVLLDNESASKRDHHQDAQQAA